MGRKGLPRRGRGKGIKSRRCWCRICHQPFLASREDADTCSGRCRKVKHRLFGGSTKGGTEKPDASSTNVPSEKGD
jgi:hypothetical protein